MCLCGFDFLSVFVEFVIVDWFSANWAEDIHCYSVGGHYGSSGNGRFLLIGLIGTEDTPKAPGFCCFDDSQR
jgi:hypothetical protein